MDAMDLSHHLSTLSKSRSPSPLKDIMKYMWLDGMVSLAGGLPHPSLFPFARLEADIYTPEASVEQDVSSELMHVAIPKFATSPDDPIDLATGLQYSPATGLKWLLKYAHDFTSRVYKPAYKNFDVLMHSGNTDAWTKAVQLLCEAGEYIIIERHTYPSAQALWIPMGCKGVPVEIDGDGMRADALESTLRDWDTTHPGVKRPHVLYTVPTGQNPTGSTMSSRRKQEIYAICSKYDLIIVEDDPYYFLQFEAYVPGETHGNAQPYNEDAFLHSLEKTFLHFDTEGRVIRLDSFSKTLAPGNRLGWFTANPLFAERLLRATEVTTQTPSGWSQAIITQLLQSWGPGISGYLVWLSRLRAQYEMRRTWMCEAIGRAFDVEEGKDGEGMVAYVKGTGKRRRIFSFIPPRTGMFLWCKLYLEGNAGYEEVKGSGRCGDPEAEYEKKLWLELADEKVLLTPGSYYTPWEGQGQRSTSAAGGQSYEIFFRLAYSMTTREDMELGIQRMAKVYARAWGL